MIMPRPAPHAPSFFTLAVKVIPGAPADRIVGFQERELVIKLRARAVDGAANRALIGFLARTLAIPKTSITLKRGSVSRHKLLALPCSCLSALEAAGKT
jgi:uncharacterized protein